MHIHRPILKKHMGPCYFKTVERKNHQVAMDGSAAGGLACAESPTASGLVFSRLAPLLG